MTKILFFGILSEISGTKEWELPGDKPLQEILQEVAGNFPAIRDKNFKISLNKKLLEEDNPYIPDGGELALLPPFSGG